MPMKLHVKTAQFSTEASARKAYETMLVFDYKDVIIVPNEDGTWCVTATWYGEREPTRKRKVVPTKKSWFT